MPRRLSRPEHRDEADHGSSQFVRTENASISNDGADSSSPGDLALLLGSTQGGSPLSRAGYVGVRLSCQHAFLLTALTMKVAASYILHVFTRQVITTAAHSRSTCSANYSRQYDAALQPIHSISSSDPVVRLLHFPNCGCGGSGGPRLYSGVLVF